MKHTPLVSVLMTSFNREKYISEAINSVLCQTFTDFELIILDDCSTDNTLEIVNSFDDLRIRVYQNDTNLGQFPNRNKAASLATGKYLKYVDSDDRILKGCLENFVGAIENCDDTYLVSCLINEKLNKRVDFKESLFLHLDRVKAYEFHYEHGGLLFVGPTGTMYDRVAFERIGGFNDELGINADVDVNLKLCALGRVAFVENCIFWRKHDQQIDCQQSDKLRMMKERYLIDYINLSQLNLDVFPKNKIGLWLAIVSRNLARNLFVQLFKFNYKATINVFFSVPRKFSILGLLIFPTFLLYKLFSNSREDLD
jgi:glycosyltransferase involved in cell wall biosynthesis